MAQSGDPRDSEIEVRHLYRVARIPFHLTARRVAIVLAALILTDVLFVIACVSTISCFRVNTCQSRT